MPTLDNTPALFFGIRGSTRTSTTPISPNLAKAYLTVLT